MYIYPSGREHEVTRTGHQALSEIGKPEREETTRTIRFKIRRVERQKQRRCDWKSIDKMKEEQGGRRNHTSHWRVVEEVERETLNNSTDLRDGDDINRLKRGGERVCKRERTDNQSVWTVVVQLCLGDIGLRAMRDKSNKCNEKGGKFILSRFRESQDKLK